MRRPGGDIRAGLARGRGRPARRGWLRGATALLVGAAGACGMVGWLLAPSRPVQGVLAWRLSFFAAAAALLLNLEVAVAVWQGRAHLWRGLRRAVPFAPAEFVSRDGLSPTGGPAGVSGRGALLGAALLGAAGVIWLGGLAFAPMQTTGTAELFAGGSTTDIRPAGMRPDGLGYGYPLPQDHTFMGPSADGQGAALQVQDPRTNQNGQYEAHFGQPVLLGSHRIALVALLEAGAASGVRLRVHGGDTDTVVDVRDGQPATVGNATIEIAEIDHDFEHTGFEAVRVVVRGQDEERSVWLLPESPELDEHSSAAALRLTPLELLRPERAVLRFTARWVWWWRVIILCLAGAGAFLLLLVPHRSWVWVGLPGDWEVRAWSLNAGASLEAWTDAALLQALGPARHAELVAIEAQLAEMAGGR